MCTHARAHAHRHEAAAEARIGTFGMCGAPHPAHVYASLQPSAHSKPTWRGRCWSLGCRSTRKVSASHMHAIKSVEYLATGSKPGKQANAAGGVRKCSPSAASRPEPLLVLPARVRVAPPPTVVSICGSVALFPAVSPVAPGARLCAAGVTRRAPCSAAACNVSVRDTTRSSNRSQRYRHHKKQQQKSALQAPQKAATDNHPPASATGNTRSSNRRSRRHKHCKSSSRSISGGGGAETAAGHKHKEGSAEPDTGWTAPAPAPAGAAAACCVAAWLPMGLA
eukprot:359919-Chlamydomonas_euryale.AAC.9